MAGAHTGKGYMNMTMVPVRCATFPKVILEICDNIKGAWKDYINPLDRNQLLVIVWNGNDYDNEQHQEIIPTSEWSSALQALKQIRKVYSPRVLIMSCTDYRRWGCTSQ